MKDYDDVQVYLANLAVLNTKLHNLHWNIEGKQFMQLHEYTEELYDEFFVMFDDIAELLKMKGEMPLVKIEDYAEKATIDELPARTFDYDEVMEAVKEDLNKMKDLAVKIREEADEVDDFEIVGEMEDHVAFYSKNLWFIESMNS